MGLLYPTMGKAELERYVYLMAEVARKAAAWQSIRDYRDYYAGRHPVLLTERQKEYLGPLLNETEHTVAHNLCGTVVDVLRERLTVEGFTGDDAASEVLAAKAWEWWQAGRMDEHQITVHRRALRDGATYVILEWDAEEKRPVWVPNRAYDGDEGVTFYRDPNTDKPVMAFKYWSQLDPLGKQYRTNRMTCYLPGEIRHYTADIAAPYGWRLVDQDSGELPIQPWTDTMRAGGKPLGLGVIEFRNPGGVSEIEGVIGLQNGLNKTWLDLFAAADATGFQMLAVSYPEGPGPEPLDDEETTSTDIKIAPGRLLELFGGATITTLAPGSLDSLLKVIETVTGAIAGVSRTPQYYLRPFGGSDVPSGEALKQLEAALVARAEERFAVFGNAWSDAVQVAAKLARAMGVSGFDPAAEVSTNWGSPAVRNELYDAQVAEIEQRLGVPDETLWERRLGYSPDDIAAFKKIAARKQASNLANVLQAVGNGRNTGGAVGNGTGEPGNGATAAAPAGGVQRPGAAGGVAAEPAGATSAG